MHHLANRNRSESPKMDKRFSERFNFKSFRQSLRSNRRSLKLSLRPQQDNNSDEGPSPAAQVAVPVAVPVNVSQEQAASAVPAFTTSTSGVSLPTEITKGSCCTFFFLGDAGAVNKSTQKLSQALKQHIKGASSPQGVVFLGDNFYPVAPACLT